MLAWTRNLLYCLVGPVVRSLQGVLFAPRSVPATMAQQVAHRRDGRFESRLNTALAENRRNSLPLLLRQTSCNERVDCMMVVT